MRSFGRITRKIYTPSSSRATRVFHDISFDARHDRYNIFALFPIVLSILQQRRSRSEQIGLHVHFRLEGTRRMFSGHVAPWFMRHDNRFVAGSMGIRRETLARKPSWPSSTSSSSIGTNRVRDKVEWYTDKRFSRFLVRGPRYSYPISLLIYFLHCFSHSLFPFSQPLQVLFPLRLPREPDVASTLANQLDFATRMRPARLNFKPLHPTRFHPGHVVSSLADSWRRRLHRSRAMRFFDSMKPPC